MRECPVCNETFGDEFNFCDLDGTALRRLKDGSKDRDPSRLASLLGVGLLLGAVIISAAAMIFLPRAHVSPAAPRPQASSSATGTGEPANKTPASETASEVKRGPDAPAAVAATHDSTLSGSTAKEKAAASGAADAELTPPDPKAAAQSGEEKPALRPNEPLASFDAGNVQRSETTPSVKAPNGTRANSASQRSLSTDQESKAGRTPAELRRDQKGRSPKDQKSRDSNSNRRPDKEKKGGFLRVFKKIFGKN